MTNIARFFALLLFIAFITACSNKPSDEELRSQVTADLLKGYRNQLYTVENFQKVNGFENDERTYTAQVQYDLVFKVDLQDAPQFLGNDSSESFLQKSAEALGLLSITAEYGNFKAGDRIPQDEKVVLIKTEKGWRLKEEFLNE
jgi:hypothetical protein